MMPGWIGGAWTVMRRDLMVCPDPKCGVEWKGKDLPCWCCGRSGVQRFPDTKEKV